MSGRLLLGIDLGTSSLKAVLVDEAGNLVSHAAEAYGIATARPGWAEQGPDDWLQAAARASRQALARADVSPRRVAAVGLSGQMHGTVCLGRQGQVLRPAIIWADQRSGPQVEQVYAALGRSRLGRLTANPVAAGFTLPTWLWLRRHEPQVAAATATLLLPKDWLRYRLTGELGTEPSDASGTLLFDPAGQRWSEPLLRAFDVEPGLLPPVAASAAQAGGLTAEMAAATGLLAGTPVAFGGADQACQALGNGVVEPGVVSCTVGTGGQLLAPALTATCDPGLRLHLFCHVLPDRWYQMAATLAAGLSLRWLRDTAAPGLSFDTLADGAARVPPGSEGLIFLPYLTGERTPHMDPAARASFVGLTLRHGRDHLARAVMEGAVFALRQGLDLMTGLDIPVDRIVASGGAAGHPLWLQLQADIFERPIYRTRTVEAAAVGAALLAGIAVGLFADAQQACRRSVRWQDQVVEPLRESVEVYRAAFQSFRQLYPALQRAAG